MASVPDRPLDDMIRKRGWRRILDFNVLVDKSELTLGIRSPRGL